MLSPDTPPSVRFNVTKEVMRLNGIDAPRIVQSDKNELTEFLKDANINVQVNQVNIPPEFTEMINDYVEGHFEVPAIASGRHEA
jgi:hypothetical protein